MYSGEPVTQLEHALQTAWQAERAGASEALVAASLLHDIGHMTNDKGETPTERGIDDLHQYHALAARRWAQDAVNLRLWDDLAKVAGERTPGWAHFEAILGRVASSN